jgi:hypothetical protein
MAAITGCVDRFSLFKQAVALSGWVFAAGRTVAALEIRPPGQTPLRFTPDWRASPDVAAALGPDAATCRYDCLLEPGFDPSGCIGAALWALTGDGGAVEIGVLGLSVESKAGALFAEFFRMVGALKAPRVLEIGARARSGITRRALLPHDALYTGCDIMAGPNVDLVCDAHALSAALPGAQFDAVMALSVLEHILMPWKLVLELNAVMQTGAIGLFVTHQTWPEHDVPWDFWRFSDRAWPALLNKATGFEILSAAMGEPAYIVAANAHPVTNFAPVPAGYLASNVIFRKVAATSLSWPVALADCIETAYPPGEVKVVV